MVESILHRTALNGVHGICKLSLYKLYFYVDSYFNTFMGFSIKSANFSFSLRFKSVLCFIF